MTWIHRFTSHLMAGMSASVLTILLGNTFPVLAAEDPPALKEFEKRIDNYVDLHKRVLTGINPTKATNDPELLVRQKEELAAGIRAGRQNARQGDMFFIGIKPIFLEIIKGELSGKDGAKNRALILGDGNPNTEGSEATVRLSINADYPSAAPLSAVPPSLLLRFPRLPEELDYRYVGRSLILRDTKANIIVDILPNAVP